MPAEEETGEVTVRTWTLDTIEHARELEDAMFEIGLDTTLRRQPNLAAAQQLKMQIDIPNSPKGPIVIQEFGARVRAITMDDTLISIERLPD